MPRTKRVAVCLDDIQRDAGMVAFLSARSRLVEPEQVFFLTYDRVGSGADAADGADDSLPDQLASVVRQHFAGGAATEVHMERLGKNPLLQTLRFAHDRDVDLIVVGRHFGCDQTNRHEALFATRITRKATCSVLVVPEQLERHADVLLVPVRDSECSAGALQAACDVAAVAGDAVVALNLFSVHAGYLRVGKSLEEHQALLEIAARRECDQLLSRVNSGTVSVRTVCVPDGSGHPVRVIQEHIETLDARAVVIGARGRTGVAGVLLGAVTEQLIRKSPVPVLAVKRKGECIGVLRALLALASQEP